MPEKWEQYYSKEQLALLQRIELENLRVFISVCEKMGLEYVAYGGTLLGVEKYGGLIPWDDDIDVAMPRESYDRFAKHASEYLPEGYFIQNPYNCEKCPYPYTKLRKKGTKYVEYANRNVDIETGVYIDIYPIDKIPDDDNLRKKQFDNVRKWIMIYVCRQTPLYDRKVPGMFGGIKRFCKWIVCKLCGLFTQEYCMKQIDQYMNMYNGSGSSRYAALNSPNYENIYEQLYPFKKGRFEELDVNLPGDYKAHLVRRYGDYSQTPSVDQRYGHVPYILHLGDSTGGKEDEHNWRAD